MKKIVAVLLLCIASTDICSGRVIRGNRTRTISRFKHVLKPEPFLLSEQELSDCSLRGVLKGHQGYLSSDEETFETETQPVSILELLEKHQSFMLRLKTYRLGLIFARSVMQPGYDVERAVNSLEKQEKSKRLFRESLVQDSKQKDMFFIERCSQRDWLERNAALRLKMQLHCINDDIIAQEVPSAVRALQERKNRMDQCKQNRKQEQIRLKQQSCVVFQKNKKLPKSQQQVKQIAHRKKR